MQTLIVKGVADILKIALYIVLGAWIKPQATIEKDQYDNWVSRFDSLHQIALSENFRSMSLIEIKKILQA